MASLLSKRLGKRSLLGTRVSTPSAFSDRMLGPGQIPALQVELSRVSPQLASYEGGQCKEQAKESGLTPSFPNLDRLQLHPGQRVYVTYNGQECAGLVEQHSQPDDEVKVLLPEQGLQACWKAEDVRLAEIQTPLPPPLPMDHSPPAAMEQSPTGSAPRSVSRNIDVPKRKSDAAVEMDEMMAAMVLTSLSCSPVVQSPPSRESSMPVSQAACDSWKESGDVSDSGSSTTSGHWSGGSDISTPSPPHPEASPKYSSEALSSPQADDGFETDSDPFLLDEPAPRKRKNSVKVMYKCLWPNCGKVLRSIVGIKRHVKTQHLGDGADSDQRKREEDFYYTEVQVKEETAPESATSPTFGSSPIVIQQALAKPEALALDQATLESPLPNSALSQSAPSSFWHIQADHAYQALPSIQIPVSPHIFTSISWAAATSTLPALSPVRSRSLSFSEHQPPPPMLKSHLIVASPPRAPSGTRKVRGEAKKCRKVYGIEHRDQWCTACRWKKACQRFLD
uniref:Zinc finger protein 395 n=1 Tax=Pelodiscus sinensis TaxID=13735 RepID=K7FHK4_PELSI|nr:zinc finger protein 395 isoform X1 [Pelodiscus sinensis]XP_006116782.1 zinc finger protein 395 isoform X2 [Pelodiscus sinensis]|eukprot:XP_006116781.1 zinc finger protein 395 isoform X1 [Pelodiscus sinensis]